MYDKIVTVLHRSQVKSELVQLIYGLIGLILLFIDIYMHGWRLSPMIIFGIGIVLFSLYILFSSYQWGRDYEYKEDK
ncbi:MAG: hypothetical protein GY927_13805 [bacterium]|nr:hypothetical protein [bacterium]